MKCLTGSETIPALVVATEIEVLFNHGCPKCYQYFPIVSTCSFSLNIPIHAKDDDEMVTISGTALFDNVGFRRC